MPINYSIIGGIPTKYNSLKLDQFIDERFDYINSIISNVNRTVSIKFDTSISQAHGGNWSMKIAAQAPWIEKTVISHELMHALGFGHNNLGMDFSVLGEPWHRNPWEDEFGPVDVALLIRKFGLGRTINNGDTIYRLTDMTQSKVIVDAGGNDTFDVSKATAGWTINLQTISPPPNGEGGDRYFSRQTGDDGPKFAIPTGVKIENATGGRGNDDIRGNDLDNLLIGNAGNDTIRAGDGDDTLVGGEGADWLNGGEGVDTASYATSSAGVKVSLSGGYQSGGDARGDTLIDVENLVGTSWNDDLTGNALANLLQGLAGNDLLRGLDGNDRLDGGAGDDTLIGGAGDDRLAGGSGRDAFVFRGPFGRDTIVDFEPGLDKIDLQGLGLGHDALKVAERRDGATAVSTYDIAVKGLGTIGVIVNSGLVIGEGDFLF